LNRPAASLVAVEDLAESLRRHGADEARLAIVLGSGLGGIAERLSRARSIPFEAIDGMPKTAVPGHSGRLVLGELAGVHVVMQQGRVHLYEGWTAHEASRAIRALAHIGCRGFLLTNAAGGVHREWRPGSLMRVVDHINLQGHTALASSEAGTGTPYDAALGSVLDRTAATQGLELHRGVYAGMLGPAYETPAEVRMLRWMGADAVGMSTVAEAAAAHAAGGRVAAISCITNPAAGLGDHELSHEDVIALGAAAGTAIADLFEAALPSLLRALQP
jgi:purine-nucleoside phosphorylase